MDLAYSAKKGATIGLGSGLAKVLAKKTVEVPEDTKNEDESKTRKRGKTNKDKALAFPFLLFIVFVPQHPQPRGKNSARGGR